jgi:hypothetical protein
MGIIMDVIITILAAIVFYYVAVSVVTSIVYFKTIQLLGPTYKALRDNRFVLQENFMGTLYFVHKNEKNWWSHRGVNQIIIFDDGAIRLLDDNGYSREYLHAGFLAYQNPFMAYWRIRFDRLLKNRGYDKV